MYGMCHSPARGVTRERDAAADAAVRSPHQRLTDADRAMATTVVRRAFADGVLGIEEVDERLSLVYAASTVGDLDQVLDDLPADWLAGLRAEEQRRERAARHARRWRAEIRSYLRVMALLAAIWLAISLSAGELTYPWPIWPALGWGIPLLLSRPSPRARTTTMPPWDFRSASSRT